MRLFDGRRSCLCVTESKKRYQDACAFLGDFCLGLVYSFLLVGPFFNTLLEEFLESLLLFLLL